MTMQLSGQEALLGERGCRTSGILGGGHSQAKCYIFQAAERLGKVALPLPLEPFVAARAKQRHFERWGKGCFTQVFRCLNSTTQGMPLCRTKPKGRILI